jgi:ribose-phosphate pyrophosphokinase
LRRSSHDIATRGVEFRNRITWDEFPDGWPNIFIDSVKDCAGKDVIFLASFHSPQVVFEQLSILYTFPRYLVRSFTVILPYFSTGTMERVDTEGQVATAKTLARLLSSIPLSATGPAQLIMFDIHALQERFYFSENIIPRLETAIPLLLQRLSKLEDHSDVSIAFPDEGAWKRFQSLFTGYELITCIKVRKETKRVVTIKDGDPRGKHVVIVDDLVQSGGTLQECSKALIKNGAKSVSAYVTHAVFPNASWRKFLPSDDSDGVNLAYFWITDSLPQAVDIAKHKPFELLSLSDIITDMLLAYDLKR